MGKFCAGVAGKLVIGAIALLLIAFGVTQCQNAQNSGREARVSEEQAEAGSNSAADAIGAVEAVSGRNTATDDLTRENADAIHNAPGAAAPVDPAVRDAGLSGLCRRAAYRDSPDCLQFTPAR
jgi:hypothetical protein